MLYIQLHNQYILLTKKPKLCLNAFSVLLGGKQDENKNTEAFKQFISYLKKKIISWCKGSPLLTWRCTHGTQGLNDQMNKHEYATNQMLS